LVEDPCLVVGSVYGLSASMERITKAQAYGPQNPMATSKRNLEVNPGHPVIRELLHRVQNANADKQTEEMAILLYEAALLNSGYTLSDPREFSNKFFKIFTPAMGISRDAQVEEVEVDLNDEDVADEPEKITPIGGSYMGDNVKETIDSNSIKIDFGEPPEGAKTYTVGDTGSEQTGGSETKTKDYDL